MGLESATFVSQLNVNNPVGGTDPKSQGDDHLRLIKLTLQNTLPNASKAFYFPTSPAEVVGNVSVATTDAGKVYAVNANAAGRTVSLPATPDDGFEITVVKSDASANTVTVDPAGAVTINGQTTLTLTRQYESIRCVYLATFAVWVGLRSVAGSPRQADEVVGLAQGGTGQTTAYTAFDALSVARVDVASAATVNLDAASLSSYIRITGTTTITAITLTAGRKRWVVFGGALTLTNGASLVLPTAANILTVAGDTALFVGEAAGVVRCVQYNRASGLALAVVPVLKPNRAYAEYNVDETITDAIPNDDTIPQVTEGKEILSAALAVQNSANRVRIRVTGFGTATATDTFIFALFVDGAANAVRAAGFGPVGNDRPTAVVFEHELAPGDTSSHTYSVRVGPGDSGSMRLNCEDINTKCFGGVAKTSVVIEEVFM